jgi:single-strand DNA-binding protein
MRYTPDGTPVCNFSVATNRRWSNPAGEQQSETTWVRCTAWRATAEHVNQYLSRGRQVYVEGRLVVDPETGGPKIWTGNDGQARASFELNVESVMFLGSAPAEGGNATAAPAAAQAAPPAPEFGGEEIPF